MAATAARISPTTLSSFYEIGILPHGSETSLRITKMPTVDHIFETLELELYQAIKTKKARKVELRKHWVRCVAHTFNLISQTFLLGQEPEEFIMKMDRAELIGNLDTFTDL
jgi:hypothetical protein